MAFQVDLGPQVAAATRYSAPRCNICRLYLGCKSPKMPLNGFGKKKILLLGESPGKTEDEKNIPFVGKSGQFLEECLRNLKIKMRKECWIYNSVICRPPENRIPTAEEISYCYPNVARTVKEIQPNVIITLGKSALESVLTGIWMEDFGAMERWVGWKIPSIDLNSWICPTWHPSYVLRILSKAKGGTAIKKLFTDHLEAAIELADSKPYDTPPDYESQIETFLDTDSVIEILDWYRKRQKPVAFDYETETLKSDEGGKIISAGISDGKKTIAFPWYGTKMIEAWKRLMESDCKKLGFNSKYEDRWSAKNGIRVNNWAYCGQIGGHIVNNQKGNCSLAFQGLVWCGMKDYSSHISPYLKSLGRKTSYSKNRIRELPLESVLHYNGVDALLTYHVCKKHLKFFGIKL